MPGIRSSRFKSPGCASDAMPPARLMMPMTSAGQASAPRHERRLSLADELIERLARIGHVTGFDERLRDQRPAERPARAVAGRAVLSRFDRLPHVGKLVGNRGERAECDRRAAASRKAASAGSSRSMKYPSTWTSRPSCTAVISMPGTKAMPDAVAALSTSDNAATVS